MSAWEALKVSCHSMAAAPQSLDRVATLRASYRNFLSSVDITSDACIHQAELKLIDLFTREMSWFAPHCLSNSIPSRLMHLMTECISEFEWCTQAIAISLLHVSVRLCVEHGGDSESFCYHTAMLVESLVYRLKSSGEKKNAELIQNVCRILETSIVPSTLRNTMATSRSIAAKSVFMLMMLTQVCSSLLIRTGNRENDRGLPCMLHIFEMLCGVTVACPEVDISCGSDVKGVVHQYISYQWVVWTRSMKWVATSGADLNRSSGSSAEESIGHAVHRYWLGWLCAASTISSTGLDTITHNSTGKSHEGPLFKAALCACISDTVTHNVEWIIKMSIRVTKQMTTKSNVYLRHQRWLASQYISKGVLLHDTIRSIVGRKDFRGKLKYRMGDIDMLLVYILFPMSTIENKDNYAEILGAKLSQLLSESYQRWSAANAESRKSDFEIWTTVSGLLCSLCAHLSSVDRPMGIRIDMLREIGGELLSMQERIRSHVEVEQTADSRTFLMFVFAYQALIMGFTYTLVNIIPPTVRDAIDVRKTNAWIQLQAIVSGVFNDHDDWFECRKWVGDHSSSNHGDSSLRLDIWLSLGPYSMLPNRLVWRLLRTVLPLFGCETDGTYLKYAYVLRHGRESGVEINPRGVELREHSHEMIAYCNIANRVQVNALYSRFVPVAFLIPQFSHDQEIKDEVTARLNSALTGNSGSIDTDPTDRRMVMAAVKCFHSRDIFLHILSYLTYKRVCRLAVVNKLCYEYCGFNPMWKGRYYRRWGGSGLKFEHDHPGSNGVYSVYNNAGSGIINGDGRDDAVQCERCSGVRPPAKGFGGCLTAAHTHNWKELYKRRVSLQRRCGKGPLCPYIGCEVKTSNASQLEKHLAVHQRRAEKRVAASTPDAGRKLTVP